MIKKYSKPQLNVIEIKMTRIMCYSGEGQQLERPYGDNFFDD